MLAYLEVEATRAPEMDAAEQDARLAIVRGRKEGIKTKREVFGMELSTLVAILSNGWYKTGFGGLISGSCFLSHARGRVRARGVQ